MRFHGNVSRLVCALVMAAFMILSQAGGASAQDPAFQDALQKGLDDADPTIRLYAVICVAKLHPDKAVPMLTKHVEKETSLVVLKTATFCLGEMRDPRAVPMLVGILQRQLKDESNASLANDTEYQLKILNEQFNKEKDPVKKQQLREKINDAAKLMGLRKEQKLDMQVLYLRAMEALGKMKDGAGEAAATVVTGLFSESLPIAYMAADTLRCIRNESVEESIVKKLGNSDPRQRRMALYALSEMQTPFPENGRSGAEWLSKAEFAMLCEEMGNSEREISNKAMSLIRCVERLPRDIRDDLGWLQDFVNTIHRLDLNNRHSTDYDVVLRFVQDEIQLKTMILVYRDILKGAAAGTPVQTK
jgi:hypothetical protein